MLSLSHFVLNLAVYPSFEFFFGETSCLTGSLREFSMEWVACHLRTGANNNYRSLLCQHKVRQSCAGSWFF